MPCSNTMQMAFICHSLDMVSLVPSVCVAYVMMNSKTFWSCNKPPNTRQGGKKGLWRCQNCLLFLPIPLHGINITSMHRITSIPTTTPRLPESSTACSQRSLTVRRMRAKTTRPAQGHCATWLMPQQRHYTTIQISTGPCDCHPAEEKSEDCGFIYRGNTPSSLQT